MRGSTSYFHAPVMVEEVLRFLQVQPGGQYVDATAGEGGHTEALLKGCTPGGRVLVMDVDPQAIQVARKRFEASMSAVIVERESYINLEQTATRHGFRHVDGILFDLGIGSMQLEGESRGFSFNSDDALDMRFNPDEELTADQVVNGYAEVELARILWEYGEEPRARTIARWIVRNRPISSARQLAQVVGRAVRGARGRTNPATRTFQALRVYVNHELENLKEALPQTVNLLKPGGRVVTISYHSLEDRVVKEFFKAESHIDRQNPTFRVITKKVVRPTAQELAGNPRARSGRLRVGERLG